MYLLYRMSPRQRMCAHHPSFYRFSRGNYFSPCSGETTLILLCNLQSQPVSSTALRTCRCVTAYSASNFGGIIQFCALIPTTPLTSIYRDWDQHWNRRSMDTSAISMKFIFIKHGLLHAVRHTKLAVTDLWPQGGSPNRTVDASSRRTFLSA